MSVMKWEGKAIKSQGELKKKKKKNCLSFN